MRTTSTAEKSTTEVHDEGGSVVSTSSPMTTQKVVSLQPGKQKREDGQDDLGGIGTTLYVVVIVVFIALFATSSFYCYRYRVKYEKLSNRNRFTESYGSTDSYNGGDTVSKQQQQFIGTSMYDADVKELENWTKFRRGPQEVEKGCDQFNNQRYFPNEMCINGALLDNSVEDSLGTYKPYSQGRPYLTNDALTDDSMCSAAPNDGGDGGVLYFVHEDKIR